MQGGWATGGDPNAQPVEFNFPILASLDVPDTAALAKPLGRRRFKVTGTAPVAATPAYRKTFEEIGNLFSHATVLLCSTSLVGANDFSVSAQT
jgi:hypothetical protein